MGQEPDSAELYRVNFDGSISDEPGLVVMGGDAHSLVEAMDAAWSGRQLAAAGFDDVIRGNGSNDSPIRSGERGHSPQEP